MAGAAAAILMTATAAAAADSIAAAPAAVPASTPASAPAAAGMPRRALQRELNRDRLQLRRRLVRLPKASGVAILRRPDSVVLRIPAGLLFAPDNTGLKPGDAAGTAALTAAVQLLRRRRRLTAQVEVYTDNIGGAKLNREMSMQRAQAVTAALSAAGVAAARLQAHGQGLQDALASNDTPAGRVQNRRVEIVFEPAAAPAVAPAGAATPIEPAGPAAPVRPAPAAGPAGG
jgi:outer membrane protein OmpA-like peptidoglycan-associated protein